MAKNDFRRLKKLGRYLKKEQKRLILILFILIPVALAGAIQPLLVGQAISVLRGEDTISLIDNKGFHEYYSCNDGSVMGANNFSWSAALYLDLVMQKNEN